MERRNSKQNAMFHAIIGQVAKQAKHLGAEWNDESWKRLLLHSWAKETGRTFGKMVPSLDGGDIVQLGYQSRKLSKEDAIEFTEWLLAWCAMNGVVTNEIPKT